MEAGTAVARGRRPTMRRRPRVRRQDQAFRNALRVIAFLILALIAFFFVRLYVEASPAFQKFGFFGFIFTNNWDVSREMFGALPLLVGTLITSGVALLIGVPVAVAAALFVSELCPRRFRGALTIVLELLAAVPSVVYGLWGVFVLIPNLQGFENWVARTFDFIPFIGGPVRGPNYFIAGLILAIMILPIVT